MLSRLGARVWGGSPPHGGGGAGLGGARGAALALGTLLGAGEAAACVAPGPPPSAADDRRGRVVYYRGVSAFVAGDFRAARAAFERSYALTRQPDLLYNLARVAEYQGRRDAARRYRARYEEICGRDAPEAAAQLAAPSKAPAGAADGPELVPRGALGLFFAGSATLTMGVALGASALATQRELSGAARFDPALDSRARQLGAAGIALDVIGGAALLAGTLWTLIDRTRDGGEGRLGRLRPAGGGLALDF